MSVYAKVWAYDQHPLQVDKDGSSKPGTKNPAAKSVLVALAEFPGVGQRECWPAQATLAAMTDFDERTVRRQMAVLEAQGYISRTERRRDGRRLTDMVTLLGSPEAFGPTPPDRVSGRGGNTTGQSVQSYRTECPGNRKENRNSSRRDAKASQEPQECKLNWFTVYCDRSKECGLPVSDEDRNRVPGNLTRCSMKEEATDQEMYRVIAHMVDRRLVGVILSPQEALKDVRGVPRVLRGGADSPDVGSGTPPEVVEAIKSREKYRQYAAVAEVWDFTKDETPEFRIMARLGGNDEERHRVYTALRSIANRTMKAQEGGVSGL